MQHTALSNSSLCTPTFTANSIGLLGDLWGVFGPRMDEYISRNEISRLIEIGRDFDASNPVINYLNNQMRHAPPPVDNEMSMD